MSLELVHYAISTSLYILQLSFLLLPKKQEKRTPLGMAEEEIHTTLAIKIETFFKENLFEASLDVG